MKPITDTDLKNDFIEYIAERTWQNRSYHPFYSFKFIANQKRYSLEENVRKVTDYEILKEILKDLANRGVKISFNGCSSELFPILKFNFHDEQKIIKLNFLKKRDSCESETVNLMEMDFSFHFTAQITNKIKELLEKCDYVVYEGEIFDIFSETSEPYFKLYNVNRKVKIFEFDKFSIRNDKTFTYDNKKFEILVNLHSH